MNLTSNTGASGLFAALALLTGLAQQPTAPPQAPAEPEPRVGVRFEGLLPGTHDDKLQGDFDVEFRIYLSPQGGDAVWTESQRVHVAGGRMDIVLGLKNAIPMSIHEATFKFLGASVGGAREVYPRFAIVNTVFVSQEEALRPAEGVRKPAADRKPVESSDAYGAPGAEIAVKSEPACKWKDALLAARAAKADLPDYEDWYAAFAHCTKDEARERSGHYEWVLPWVYDTASHGEYNRLFRGRFQGCDYMDLSPANSYVYRLAKRPPADVNKASTPTKQ